MLRSPPKSSDAEIENRSQRVRGYFIAAERELSAFFTAVNTIFGAEQARKSAIHWIEEMESMNWPPDDSMPKWRQATLAASARLAADLTVSDESCD